MEAVGVIAEGVEAVGVAVVGGEVSGDGAAVVGGVATGAVAEDLAGQRGHLGQGQRRSQSPGKCPAWRALGSAASSSVRLMG